ncbi:uncharacterized protein VICG_00328 [Vittaforma corneae ATCC 50505]|uniref:Uncharacterized protein n=1 Tax=Vittaforma corneae (strain ATCC 50505) TaxID=993615 RepID=L2GP13_VITCO|nr:uncharacterized protein VICG_00328 [Vittaforma corneae ATCC 50505]ELA42576.1 hypothetical protein VICG_00328 [Vittaforma corneae ATCC 50505]
MRVFSYKKKTLQLGDATVEFENDVFGNVNAQDLTESEKELTNPVDFDLPFIANESKSGHYFDLSSRNSRHNSILEDVDFEVQAEDNAAEHIDFLKNSNASVDPSSFDDTVLIHSDQQVGKESHCIEESLLSLERGLGQNVYDTSQANLNDNKVLEENTESNLVNVIDNVSGHNSLNFDTNTSENSLSSLDQKGSQSNLASAINNHAYGEVFWLILFMNLTQLIQQTTSAVRLIQA